MSHQTFEDYILAESNVETITDYVYRPSSTVSKPTSKGHVVVGHTWSGENKDKKGANILQHGETKKYFAAGGSSTSVLKGTKFFDTEEEAAHDYHNR